MLNRLLLALFIYIVIVALLLIVRPASMFMANGDPKKWGADNSDTTSIFAPAIVFPILAILAYYMAIWIEVITA